MPTTITNRAARRPRNRIVLVSRISLTPHPVDSLNESVAYHTKDSSDKEANVGNGSVIVSASESL
jgi:hypothetical protein